MTYRNMVLGEAKKQGLFVKDLMKMLGVSSSTLYRLLDEPDRLSRAQLKMLNKYTKISMSDLLYK